MTLFVPSRRQSLGFVAASTLVPFRRGRAAASPLFEEISPSMAGAVFQKQFPARGLAIGDYNNDGRIDWPATSKRVERVTDLPIDRYVTIVEGQGRIKG